MARNEHKRKQKLLKKKQRTNDLNKQRNVRLNPSNRQVILSAALRAPWIGCYVGGGAGMQTVYAIRQTRSGSVASVFLVDTYCLGIKDAFFIKNFDMEGFRNRTAQMESKSVSPEYALKFIQDAIAFAKNIGFDPSSQTGLCKMIFGNVDPTTCSEEFVFGLNGKPTYMSGPYDSPDKQQSILETLGKLGTDGYSFALGGSLGEERFSDYEESDDDEDYDDDYNDDDYEHDEFVDEVDQDNESDTEKELVRLDKPNTITIELESDKPSQQI